MRRKNGDREGTYTRRKNGHRALTFPGEEERVAKKNKQKKLSIEKKKEKKERNHTKPSKKVGVFIRTLVREFLC